MKTFLEAAHMIAASAPGDNIPPQSDIDRLEDIALRYKDLIEEASGSEYFAVLVEHAAGIAVHLNIKSAVATAFFNGLLIGMEMERSEFVAPD